MTHEVMTQNKWLEKVRASKDKLRSLISTYHPTSYASHDDDIVITAPNAEIACNKVRDIIRRREANMDTPAQRFDKALETGNTSDLMELLSAAWFGVPESTECWGIEGFKECVDLLDDPPRE